MGKRCTQIIGLETTTFCNRECSWCLNPAMDHATMTPEIFQLSIAALKKFEPTREVALSGCGEPLLDPLIVERVKTVADLGYDVVIYTNGDLLTEELAGALKESGIKKIRVAGKDTYSPSMGGSTHNWAGQHPGIKNELMKNCTPKEKRYAYITVDGSITQCCLDYSAKYPIGHVSLAEEMIECGSIPLCNKCGGSP